MQRQTNKTTRPNNRSTVQSVNNRARAPNSSYVWPLCATSNELPARCCSTRTVHGTRALQVRRGFEENMHRSFLAAFSALFASRHRHQDSHGRRQEHFATAPHAAWYVHVCACSVAASLPLVFSQRSQSSDRLGVGALRSIGEAFLQEFSFSSIVSKAAVATVRGHFQDGGRGHPSGCAQHYRVVCP